MAGFFRNLNESEIGLIFIKRDKEAVVNSFFRINCKPINSKGREWLIHPLMKDPVNKVSIADKLTYRMLYSILSTEARFLNALRYNLNKLKFTERYSKKMLDCYVEETYAQAELFKQKFPNIKVFETTIDKLNEEKEFKKIFDYFGLDFKPNDIFYEKLSKKTNLKVYNKN